MLKVKQRCTLKLETSSSPETSLTYHSTRRHIAENSHASWGVKTEHVRWQFLWSDKWLKALWSRHLCYVAMFGLTMHCVSRKRGIALSAVNFAWQTYVIVPWLPLCATTVSQDVIPWISGLLLSSLCLPLFYSVISIFHFAIGQRLFEDPIYILYTVLLHPNGLHRATVLSSHIFTRPVYLMTWRRGHWIPPKRWSRFTRLHDITSEDSLNFFVNVILMLRVVKCSAHWKVLILCPLSPILYP